MNNEQFRELLFANASKIRSEKHGSSTAISTPTALGSKRKSSIPMTPRSVGGGHVDFAKQLADRQSSEKSQKKFRSSAPRGSKLAQGYTDRAKAREEPEEDDKLAQIKALEDSFKKEEIDRVTYERLRGEIAGGDLSSTHLVKGLDRKLLERVRKGEDVYSKRPETTSSPADVEPEIDPDEELSRLEATEVKAVVKQKARKKGQLALTALPGQKRSRDQILAELMASREAAKLQAQSTLGSKFKKIGEKQEPSTRTQRDSHGREVIIFLDEDGNEKRKVRKVDMASKTSAQDGPLISHKPLGMEVPGSYQTKQHPQVQEVDEDAGIKIFDDVGSDYDPLAGLESDDSEKEAESQVRAPSPNQEATAQSDIMPPPRKHATETQSINYFRNSKTGLASEKSYQPPSVNDPTFLAALKKAKAISAAHASEEEQKTLERERKLKEMFEKNRRDDEDLDLGFGSSRREDEADLDGSKAKLSAWRDDDDGDDEDDDGPGGGRKEKRKRSKKKKRDKNSIADIMTVMERKKAG